MLHTSYIELSKSALQNNISFVNRQIPTDVIHSMVLKANAYGHGIEDLVPMIEGCGLTHFSVFSVDEAIRVYEAKKEECDIMVMGWVDDDYIEWVIRHDVSFFVFTMARLHKTLEVAIDLDSTAKIHLELETGMHRTGFHEDDLEEVIELLEKYPDHLFLQGLCTHYAGAEHLVNHKRVKDQIKAFYSLCTDLKSRGIEPRYHHTACTAALMHYPDTIMDLVRIGIANYGLWPSDESKTRYLFDHDDADPEGPLERVLSWKSKIMSINPAEEGEYISYGQSFKTNRPSLIATVPVGYGYGFNRTLSNLGHVLAAGKRVSVIGAVNMNMMVIDVTDVGEDLDVGDEVVLIGKQGDREISVNAFGAMNNSMNYELLTRLPANIPRYVVE